MKRYTYWDVYYETPESDDCHLQVVGDNEEEAIANLRETEKLPITKVVRIEECVPEIEEGCLYSDWVQTL